MKQTFLKILGALFRNIIAFFVGAALSIATTILISYPSLQKLAANKEAGLAMIAIIPVFIIYSVFFGFAGGIAGIIIYNLVKFFRRNRSSVRATE